MKPGDLYLDDTDIICMYTGAEDEEYICINLAGKSSPASAEFISGDDMHRIVMLGINLRDVFEDLYHNGHLDEYIKTKTE